MNHSEDKMQTRGERIRALCQSRGLAVLAHAVFASAAIYFSFLFLHPASALESKNGSFAFIRNLGVAVTFWAALGMAFNFAVTHARTAERWLSGLNIIILGSSVLLCLAAMANHTNTLAHAFVVHLVLTLSVVWAMVARRYYKHRSRAWHQWFEENMEEDIKIWLAYLPAAYLPFYFPYVVKLFNHGNDASIPKFLSEENIGAFSDGITGFILFIEFFSFWWNLRKQHHRFVGTEATTQADDEPPPAEDILHHIRQTKTINVGFFHWPPVVDCVLDGNHSDDGHEACKPAGFYGQWLTKVAENNQLRVISHRIPWHSMKDVIKQRDVDILVCAFITDKRREYADFSRPFHQCAMHGVVQAGEKDWDIDAVKAHDAKIVIAKSEVGYEFAARHLDYTIDSNDPRFTVIETHRIEEVASIVLGGTSDYIAIADALSIHKMQKEHQDALRVVLDKPHLDTCKLAIMFLKHQPSLKAWIDAEFERARNDPDIKKAEAALMQQLGPTGIFSKL